MLFINRGQATRRAYCPENKNLDEKRRYESLKSIAHTQSEPGVGGGGGGGDHLLHTV